ncbi:MAG: TolC family protein [Pseudomonadota bacterium]|nr:TolC family protein [Pseudomonadota bacterium]
MLSHFLGRHRTVAGLAALLCVATTAYASERPLTLDAAVQRGLASAPQLEARSADITAAQEELARAGRFPDPSLTFGLNNYPVTAPGAYSLRSNPMTMRSVGIMQVIPSRATRDAERERAGAQIDVAVASRITTAQTQRERIADAWIGVWANGKQLALLRELQDESALAVKMAKARLRGGEGSATDVLAARAEALTLDNQLEAGDAALSASQASLQRWLGDAMAVLAEAPDFARLPMDPSVLEHSIDQQAPLQLWQAREQMADAALTEARAAKHPNWSVGMSYAHRAPGLSDTVSVQVDVSLPLFTRNRQDRGISAKQAARDAVQADHEDARRAQREAVARTIATWQGWGRQIVRDQDALLPLARDRAHTALAAYRGGGALQPWLDARRDELQLRLTYADALAARAQLWASLAYLLPVSETTP